MRTQEPAPLFSPWDLATAGGLLALAMFYSRIVRLLPDPVPTHFNALGQANGWTAKADLPLVLLGLTVLPWLALFLVGALIAQFPSGPGANPRFIHPLRGLLGLGMAILMGGCLGIPLFGMKCLAVGLAAFIACMVLGIVLLILASARSLAALPPAAAVDRAAYRWGIFYVNPEDPRVWVEKRIGVGWTLNYARPAAFWITALLLLPVLLALLAAHR